jgi:hypothetical protein
MAAIGGGTDPIVKKGRWTVSRKYISVTDTDSDGFQLLRIEDFSADRLTLWVHPGSPTGLRATLRHRASRRSTQSTLPPSVAAPAPRYAADDFIGSWQSLSSEQLPQGSTRPAEFRLELSADRRGYFDGTATGKRNNFAVGAWDVDSEYLVVNGANGGYIAFRVVHLSDEELSVVNPEGASISFSRLTATPKD